ncbi:MAG: hypothetical protein KGJ74_07530 [Betaproteobacteria bacterium]|nr:hypothetical protein [Betaproteobacteria bacterium]
MSTTQIRAILALRRRAARSGMPMPIIAAAHEAGALLAAQAVEDNCSPETWMGSEGLYRLSDLVLTLASHRVDGAEDISMGLPPMDKDADERAGGLALWIAEELYPWPQAA